MHGAKTYYNARCKDIILQCTVQKHYITMHGAKTLYYNARCKNIILQCTVQKYYIQNCWFELVTEPQKYTDC